MAWLKHVVVDLVVTALIVVAVATGWVWAQWIVWIYTPLMLALKIFAFFSGLSRPVKGAERAVPTWFYHVVYGVNVAVLLAGAWWIVAGAWALIWLLSALADRRR